MFRRWRSGAGDLIAGLACVWVFMGASYFGFYSCSNYAWKTEAFRVGAWTLALAAVAIPGRRLATWPRRLLFPVVLWMVYVLLESAVAPFYPSAPETWREYFETFLIAMEYGPCG